VTSLTELNEAERQYFLKAGEHVLKNYNWAPEKFTAIYNQLIEEFQQIQWE
jgi:hypothetical protein